jgi:N-methylhydantoinase A
LLSRFGGYLDRLETALGDCGFGGRLWVMGMTGGVIPADVAARRPVETIRSGPVGGIIAGARIGEQTGKGRLIAADMGGTSFDVGLLVDGDPQQTDLTLVGQFHLAVPGVDVRSIGAGGGSIAWLDELGGLHVGPRSAGSDPGPACYGRGGTEPTVTDADVVLGRLDPANVLGGTIRLDADAAARAIGTLAGRMGRAVEETAAGIVRVADAQMADLIRTTTLERGYDPRDFTLVAYGGAGPLHVGRFAADVGVPEAVIPASAAVLSALGLATASYRRTYRRSRRMRVPLEPEQVRPVVTALVREARSEFADSGFEGRLVLTTWADVRYQRQTHQLRVPWRMDAAGRIHLSALVDDFEAMYARTFGAGTGYAAAGIEVSSIGLDATAKPARNGSETRPIVADRDGTAGGRHDGRRRVWFDDWIDDTPVVSASELADGATVRGPAVIEMPAATLIVHPGQRAAIDDLGNAVLGFATGTTP